MTNNYTYDQYVYAKEYDDLKEDNEVIVEIPFLRKYVDDSSDDVDLYLKSITLGTSRLKRSTRDLTKILTN